MDKILKKETSEEEISEKEEIVEEKEIPKVGIEITLGILEIK